MNLDGYLGALGQLPSYDQMRMAATQIRGQKLDNQFREGQLTAQTQAQQQEAAFEADVKALGAKPTVEALRQLAVRNPKFADGLSKVAAGMDTQRRQQIISDSSQIYSALGNKQPQIAAGFIKRHIEADKAAGREPDPADTSLLELIESGDQDKMNAARGMVYATIGGIDPKAAEGLAETATPGGKRSVVGRALVDSEGKVLYRDPDPERYLTVNGVDANGKPITSVIRVGGEGGGQTSGAPGVAAPRSGNPGAPSGRTFGGWTPRARNGGDNPDRAVDGKINGMTVALGLGPDDDISRLSPIQIAKALTLSEGGAGSLADRNNNPGNLTDGKGNFRKFPTKEAGLAAAAAQVQRNLKRGQTTIRTMVEGLPVGGQSRGAPAAPQSGASVVFSTPGAPKGGGQPVDPVTDADAINNDAEAMIQNGLRMPPGSARNQAWVAAVKNRAAAIMKERGISPLEAMRGGQDFKAAQKMISGMADTKPGTPGGIVRSGNVGLDHMAQLKQAFLALKTGNVQAFNRISQWWQRQTGSPLPTNAQAIGGIVSGEMTKAVIGSAGALADREDLHTQLQNMNSPDQGVGVIDQFAGLMGAQLRELRRQYEATTNRKDFVKYLSPRAARLIGVGAPAAGAAPVKVKSIQQARALPPGTVFIDPNGVRRVR